MYTIRPVYCVDMPRHICLVMSYSLAATVKIVDLYTLVVEYNYEISVVKGKW